MIKKHWPVLFSVFAILVSVIFMLIAINSTDTGYAILAMVITFMFLFPISGALIGGWYGWKTDSVKKWVIPFMIFAGIAVYLLIWGMVTQSGLLEAESYILLGVPSCITCLIAEMLFSIIAKFKNKKS